MIIIKYIIFFSSEVWRCHLSKKTSILRNVAGKSVTGCIKKSDNEQVVKDEEN